MNQVSTTRVPLSVIVPIKNEAENLPRALASIAWADEIFVVDSGSTDGSIEIARAAGATVVQFEFNGTWPKKKNWSLEHLPFRNEWVFILDADEVVPEGAQREFADCVSGARSGIAGYWINRRFWFIGSWLRHAYFPNWNLRLFKHRLGRFEKLTGQATHSGDNEVHEHLIVDGLTEKMSCCLDHYAFPTVETFVEKHNRYSNWEARVALERAAASSQSLQHEAVAQQRRLKALAARLPGRPILRFLYVYFWQKAFLDGWEGFYFAGLHGFYEFLTVAKTYELRKQLIAGKGK